jgi:hypothetical protein
MACDCFLVLLLNGSEKMIDFALLLVGKVGGVLICVCRG